jgi:chaperone modulatory protein CbpM
MAPRKPTERIELVVVSEGLELSLLELCEACGVNAECLFDMIQEGVLEPRGIDPAAWRFDVRALDRARMATRLQRDLELNLAGAALVLDLLDELRTLRRRVDLLERQLLNP